MKTEDPKILPAMTWDDFLARIKAPPRRWVFCVSLLAALYRLAVMAGFVYLVHFVLLIGAGGWLFLILPVALFFLAVAPKFPKE